MRGHINAQCDFQPSLMAFRDVAKQAYGGVVMEFQVYSDAQNSCLGLVSLTRVIVVGEVGDTVQNKCISWVRYHYERWSQCN